VDETKAGTAFEQLFTQNNGKVDGVISASYWRSTATTTTCPYGSAG